jgi:hypothetical protein
MKSLWHDRKCRGILCEEWTNFEAFQDGVGERPGLSHSLMRKDERRPYGPDNFQWVQEKPRKSRPVTVRDWDDPVPSQKRLRESNKDKYRRYGITAETYTKMLQDQNELCAICGDPERRAKSETGTLMRLVVDHCHETLKVRALLCWRCNIGLGVAKDSIKVLQKMIEYLEFHGTKDSLP